MIDADHRSVSDFPYAPLRPPRDLIDVVVCQWNACMVGDHLMVPDACVEVMWLEGRGMIVCGPETSSWPVHHERAVMASGVRLRPGAVEFALGVPAHAIADNRVAVEDVLSSTAARRWSERVESAAATQRSGVIADLVRERMIDLGGSVGLATRIVDHAVGSGGLGDLADTLGTTTRTLHRSSLRAFGYGPATLRSILRLQRALAIHAAAPSMGVAEIAACAGYVDQAHFAKDVRRRAGVTPAVLLGSPAAEWHGAGAVVDVRSIQDSAGRPSVPSWS